MRRKALLLSALVLSSIASCSEPAPRMHVTRHEVPLGDPVVVHLEELGAKPRAGDLWLTLAPEGAPEDFVGERVVVDANATHASVPTRGLGRFEVRLHDGFPRRTHHRIARAKVDVVIESASATNVPK